MNIRTKSVAAAVAVAASLGLAGVTLAQPHGHHGRHHGDVTMAIAALKDKLSLNTSQQAMWESAVAQSRSARESARANFGKVRTTLTAELAKAEPDLAAVAAASDEVQAANATLRQQARNAWLALYATFTPEQKAVVRDALQQRVARMERFRERMKERHHRG
jgi:Spy/CpxP family protein refolding chaperone